MEEWDQIQSMSVNDCYKFIVKEIHKVEGRHIPY